MIILCLF